MSDTHIPTTHEISEAVAEMRARDITGSVADLQELALRHATNPDEDMIGQYDAERTGFSRGETDTSDGWITTESGIRYMPNK